MFVNYTIAQRAQEGVSCKAARGIGWPGSARGSRDICADLRWRPDRFDLASCEGFLGNFRYQLRRCREDRGGKRSAFSRTQGSLLEAGRNHGCCKFLLCNCNYCPLLPPSNRWCRSAESLVSICSIGSAPWSSSSPEAGDRCGHLRHHRRRRAAGAGLELRYFT